MPKTPPKYCGATVHESRLSNGMKVLVAERHSDPVVAVMVWYGVGGRHERPEEAGVSHFLEHMMFKGTDTLGKGAIDLETTVLGGSNNAFTTPDHTAYWFEFASDRWERALDLEADRMQSLALDPEEFASEKQVVLEELSMGLDDPWRALSEKVSTALFGRHPYAHPVIGYRDTLIPMTPADMRAHYERFYRPGNATLVIAGDVDPKRAIEAAEERFGKIADPEPSVADERRPPPAPDFSGLMRIETTWDDQASRLIMAWPGGVFGSDDDFVLDVVVTVLTSGKLARLYRRAVVNEGLATSVSANNDARQSAGGFWIYAEAVQGVAPATLEAVIDEEVARLRTELVNDDELTRAKKLLHASEAFESETITDVAETLGEYATDLEWKDALRVSERRNAVTAEMVRETCARLLSPGRRIIGWSLPEAAAIEPQPA
ncbi:Protease 3 precursor [Planctomycetes bacterium Poly30]|uniref:Protease 3 n=1 Tax=Saltatorellus ferox TaxID=2528018 RepID=A0A518EZC4_9BACT|nr:Protease 3 precursor [Planctomycetes bacterium Poly30]